MHRRSKFPRTLTALCDDQAGVVAVHQLLAAGLTRKVIRRMADGWDRLSEGIYLTRAPTWTSAVWAGLLRAGTIGALSGQAGAYLNGALRDEPPEVMIWIPWARRQFQVGPYPVVFRRGERSGFGHPKRTSVETSLVDLATVSDERLVTSAVSRAFARHLTTPARLLRALDVRVRTRHSAHIRELCLTSSAGIESALEWLFHRDVLVPHGLPLPDRQRRKSAGRVDGCYDQYHLIVELDGMRDHQDWSRDMMRDNDHAVDDGAVTLRYGWTSTTQEPCRCATQLAAALRSRGWTGTVGTCRRC